MSSDITEIDKLFELTSSSASATAYVTPYYQPLQSGESRRDAWGGAVSMSPTSAASRACAQGQPVVRSVPRVKAIPRRVTLERSFWLQRRLSL